MQAVHSVTVRKACCQRCAVLPFNVNATTVAGHYPSAPRMHKFAPLQKISAKDRLRSGQLTLRKNIHGCTVTTVFYRMNINLLGVDKGVVAYKTFISEF